MATLLAENEDSTVKMTAEEKETLSEQAQTFWLQWVEAAFPDLDSRAYFLPPVYVNRVPMTRRLIAGQDVLVLVPALPRCASPVVNPSTATEDSSQPLPVYDSDITDDAAMKRIFMCLQKCFTVNKEGMIVMVQLKFDDYLGTCSGFREETAAKLLSADRPKKKGEFDFLFINRRYGCVVCEVKSIGSYVKMSQQDLNTKIREKLKIAISQLEKAEKMVSYMAPGVRITKTIAVPNLSSSQVQQAISDSKGLIQKLCTCLGARNPEEIAQLCLCSDQLPDPETPSDVNSNVMRKFRKWWKRRVTSAGWDMQMTSDMYKTLAARCCGPATTVYVPCTFLPRRCIKTQDEAVDFTGQCYTALITLFPEQVDLLFEAPDRIFLEGPPGTGKTVVLQLMGAKWLECGHSVYIVSAGVWSRASCSMLHNLLLENIKTLESKNVTPGQLYSLQYDFASGDVEKAVNDLSQAASEGSLYVIADEATPDYASDNFQSFCDKLLIKVHDLKLWAASCYFGDERTTWRVKYLTRPLRSPPVVVREVEQDGFITQRYVQPYRERPVVHQTDGLPIQHLYHRSESHSSFWSEECVTCGHNVASFLHTLRVGAQGHGPASSAPDIPTRVNATPSCLEWRDVMILFWTNVTEDSGIIKGLREKDILVQLLKDDDIEDLSTANSNVVWVASGFRVRGLERKVVVCLKTDTEDSFRLHFLSRCTSQLMIVFPN